MKQAVVASLALFFASCATVPKGEAEDLKPAMRALYQSFRWKDFRGASEMMVAERRDAFVKARTTRKDDRDLFITNFELEDAKLSADMLVARAVARLSWYRLPSSTEETATITNVFVWREGTWQLESQDEGPFEELRPPAKPAVSDAGT